MDKKKMVPAFWPFFKANGYKKKGNTFFKIENDIAFCITFERPSGFIRVNYYFLPLYIPTEVIYITYGFSSENHPVFPVPSYNTLAEDEERERILQQIRKANIIITSPEKTPWHESQKMHFPSWMLQVQQCLTENIFPFFESINSPEKLLCFLRKDVFEIRKYTPFLGDEYRNSHLAAYTCLSIPDLKSASEYLALARTHLLAESHRHWPETLKKWLDELDVLEQMINAPQEVREAFIRDTIAHTLETCFRIRPQETKGS